MVIKRIRMVLCTLGILLMPGFCPMILADTTPGQPIFEVNGMAIYKTVAHVLVSVAKARNIEVTEDFTGGTVKIKIANSTLSTELSDLYNRAMSRTRNSDDYEDIVLERNSNKAGGEGGILSAMQVNVVRGLIIGVRTFERE